MDKTRLIGYGAAVVLALAGLAVWLIPVGYGMTALVLLALGAGAAFYTWVIHAKRKKLIKWVTVSLCLCFGLFLAAEIAVVDQAVSDGDADADFLVVMGAGINETEPSTSLLDRLTVALAWLQAHPDARAIVSGSQGPNEIATEASVMAAWLEDHGIAPERILLEEAATTTRENVLYSYAVAAKAGGGRVAFVSSEYHLCRMRMLIRSLGFEPVCFAAKTSRPLLVFNQFVREAFAVWQIWVFGIDA